jgi:drug/metabolite transporter (DMT)-like permease
MGSARRGGVINSPSLQPRRPVEARKQSMNVVKAISLKVMSALLFAVMSALVRFLGEKYPVGQTVFFRSLFAIPPVLLIYAWRNELAAAVRTTRPLGHVGRGLISIGGMFSNFSALARLPIVDATAISFVAPLITVALSAIVLKERVRIYRWSAVIVGFLGILVMLGPHFDLATHAGAAGTMAGLAFAITGAFCNSGSVIQTRRLTETETTSSIGFYFSLICALAGLATWPLGWLMPTGPGLLALIAVGLCGGVAHILLTESYRLAPASMVAPYDYTSMIWAFVLGYVFFDELPTVFVFAGAAIIAGAGLFVLWRERQLGLKRLPPIGG